MLVKLLRPVVVRGHPDAKIGDEIEVIHDLSLLLAIGAVEPVTLGSKLGVQTREPAVENRDPVIVETPRVKSSLRKPAK